MSYTLLQSIAKNNEDSNSSPTSTIINSSDTYIIYGAISIGSVTGYKIKKVTSLATGSVIKNTFLPESLRKSGANGSGANVNFSEDAPNSILLLTDSSVSFS